MSSPRKLHDDFALKHQEEIKKRRFSLVGKGWGKGIVDHAIFSKRMLHPYFWLNWIGVFCFKLIVICLPYSVLMLLGKWIGRLLGSIIPARKYILKRNLELAYPQLDEISRKALSRKILENAGMAIFETGIAWFYSDRRFLKHIVIDPQQQNKALEIANSQRPILVFTAHFVTLEIMARAYALLITPGIGVYRPSDHPVWEYTQVKGRLRSNLALVDRKDPKSMLRCLMRNLPIWYAPDQDYGAKVSVFVPFFAVNKAATVTGTHNLAKVKGTVVQPSFTVREKDKYRLYILDPFENFPTADTIADTTYCNQMLEKMINTAPEQYLWLHRRFKSVPPNSDCPPRYPKIK